MSKSNAAPDVIWLIRISCEKCNKDIESQCKEGKIIISSFITNTLSSTISPILGFVALQTPNIDEHANAIPGEFSMHMFHMKTLFFSNEKYTHQWVYREGK